MKGLYLNYVVICLAFAINCPEFIKGTTRNIVSTITIIEIVVRSFKVVFLSNLFN